MSSEITPVRLDALLGLTEDFFGTHYATLRLGAAGHWDGSDLSRLRLKEPVQAEEFQRLFTFRDPRGRLLPPPGWMDANPVVAQRLTFDAKPEINTLWALGSSRQREAIASAHSNSVSQAMSVIHGMSLFESESPHPLLGRGCLFTRFTEGATADLTPRLRTTVLIAQQYRLPSGRAVRFPLDLAPGIAKALFERWEWRRLSDEIGLLGMTEGTRVPQGLLKPLTDKEHAWAKTLPSNDRLHLREMAFERWRNQAADFGFGQHQAQELFQSARRLGRGLRAQTRLLTQDSVGAFWDAASRTGARRLAARERDHGPSI